MTYTLQPLPAPDSTLASAASSSPKIPTQCADAKPGDLVPDFAALFAPGSHAGMKLDTDPGTVAGDALDDLNSALEYVREYVAGKDLSQMCTDPDACTACEPPITPRAAWLLYTTATWIVGQAYVWAELTDTGWVAEMLPPVARRWAEQHDDFLAKFAGSIRDIALQLEAGQVPTPQNTAAEMALHCVLAEVEGTVAWLLDCPDGDGNVREFESLPDMGDNDEDWARLSELLFEDHDVLMLFDPAMDGIEDSETVRMAGVVNLHPRDWFVSFYADAAAEV